MVGTGLVLRFEARLFNGLWRRVCVKESLLPNRISETLKAQFFKDSSYLLLHENRVSLFGNGSSKYKCRSSDTEENDTSTSDVIIGVLSFSTNSLEIISLQNATDCSDIGLINLNAYCSCKYGNIFKLALDEIFI